MSQDSCFQANLKSVSNALDELLSNLSIQTNTEYVAIEDALNRILAEDIITKTALPQWHISAMDGIAVDAQSADEYDQLEIIGKSLAGAPYSGSIEAGQAVIITTGACLPDGATAVVMKEQCSFSENSVTLPKAIKVWNHVRKTGTEMASGSLLLEAGNRVNQHVLGLLASLGYGQVKVYAHLKIGIFSTGDELVLPNEELGYGEIYDSNRYGIKAFCHKLGYLVTDYGLIEDSPEVIEQVMLKAASEMDVLITSGGVSVGEADHIVPILKRIGDLDQWKLAIKPGKPIAIGKVAGCQFFGLPGNPVSAMVTFDIIVTPALQKMSGGKVTQVMEIAAECVTELRKKPGRKEYQRGFAYQENGTLKVRSTGFQGSALLVSLVEANCYIVLDEECSGVVSGDKVNIQLLDSPL